MSMTKREIMETLLRHLHVLDCMPPKSEVLPHPEVVAFVKERIAELEAEARVEKKREQPHMTNRVALTSLDQRVASLTESGDMVADYVRELRADLDSANARIEGLEERSEDINARLSTHRHHDPPGDSGECYYP